MRSEASRNYYILLFLTKATHKHSTSECRQPLYKLVLTATIQAWVAPGNLVRARQAIEAQQAAISNTLIRRAA